MYLQTVQLHQGLTQSGRSSVVNVLAQSTQFPGFHPQRNTHTSTHTYNNKVSSASIWVCLPNVCCPLQTRLFYGLIHISRETLHFPAVSFLPVYGNSAKMLWATHCQRRIPKHLEGPYRYSKGFYKLATIWWLICHHLPNIGHRNRALVKRQSRGGRIPKTNDPRRGKASPSHSSVPHSC